jgi:hypothetical protein
LKVINGTTNHDARRKAQKADQPFIFYTALSHSHILMRVINEGQARPIIEGISEISEVGVTAVMLSAVG